MTSTRHLSPAEWDLWHSWMEAQRVLTSEVDRSLQAEVGISKAEFSILRTLREAPRATLRVGDLSAALRWEKSRVSHLLSRMENRDLVERIEDGAPGRRTAVRLSRDGRATIDSGLQVHEDNVRRLFVDPMTTEQADAIRTWSDHTIASQPPATVGLVSPSQDHQPSFEDQD